jgi:hypothetical protein
MDFIETRDEAFWNAERRVVVSLRRDGNEFSLGQPRDGTEVWMPVVVALPEDRIEGHPGLLGIEVYEHDETFNPDIILRTYPQADFTPENFVKYIKSRAKQTASQALHSSDWMIIRNVETGEKIPEGVAEARRAVRDSVEESLLRLDSLSPSEYLDFAPIEVHTAAKNHNEFVESLDED